MLRACSHHGFSELTQIDTFYNGLNEQDQDSLNSVAGGNLLSKTTREALKIIKNKSKVHYLRSKSNVSRVNTNSRDSSSKTDDRIDKLADQISNLVEIVNKQVITPATAKAVEKTYVIYGGAHAYYDCIATISNQPSVCAANGSFFQNQASTLGTLSINIVPNPNGEMKAITTRSGLAYEGPSIPTNSPLEKVVERDTEEITDKEHLNCLGRIDVCHALADLGTSINFMPLSIWKKLSLPELTPTRMTLELVDISITNPKGVAEDVFVKVGKFHFPTDFVVVDFEADPRVPLILRRSFFRIGRALIDVYGEEITLRGNDESVTFNLTQTMRYSSTYDDNSVNRVHVIDIACEEFVQDVLDFQYNSKSSNPTLVSNLSFSEETKIQFRKEPIVKYSSSTLTPFGESDFFLEEIEDFLKDESIPTGIEDSFYDPEGDILYLKKLLNDDPSQLPLMDLKQTKETKAKSSIKEPPKLELKELLSHLEYAFLEDTNKLPVIIEKDLKDVEKEALLKVLKSHKRAIAWKIFDIKGIDSRFCTHKILIKEDYKPAIQSQRRVNLKIHDVIKKEVIKLLDAEMIYLISDSPWVSPIHCVPKKGGMTVVANENNELILIRLVTGWRACIDYRKLNDATRKDRFSLPFMDQMLERLAGNKFYCFLDGFSRYFQIPIDPQDQEKTTFTCLYGTFAYRRMPFGLCNAPGTFQSDFAIGAVLGQRKMKYFQLIHYASKTMTVAQIHYTTTEKEMLVVVYAFEKFRPYLVLSKNIVYTDHTARKYLLSKQDAKPRGDHGDNLIEKKVFDADFMGPLPSSKGNKYILVAVDYLSKWVEAKALPTNDAQVVVKFLKSLFSRFGTPRAIISDRGTHFYNDQFARVMTKYGVTHRLAIAYHPQTSGKVEVSNREHKAYWALKHVNFDLKTVGDHRKLQPNELNELRDQAYENSLIYKERTKKLHDSKTKNHIFNVSDQVLLFNSRLKIFSRKLKTQLSQPDGPNFKVNGHRVKHYFGGDIPSKVVPDLHTFLIDK
uniref:RNA-directed DNA polymerase n=1 Tax=Tanacetum cinerariifolium TaxID=118510 RepID=A0A6L2LE47_TANCI|nr:DNA-directed DNA polymerase [Tanacetum cinerariifolium]GEU99003.1 DNA-directed DNA polymerase [Tanacetum cinerariifolium]